MRGRHFPRLCRSCDAPLARKDDACWRCDEAWADQEDSESAPKSARTASPPDGQSQPDAETQPAKITADAELVRNLVQVG